VEDGKAPATLTLLVEIGRAPSPKRGVHKTAASDPLKLLGDRVRQARARRGMTRKQFARDSGARCYCTGSVALIRRRGIVGLH
jgi:hypothetical protein